MSTAVGSMDRRSLPSQLLIGGEWVNACRGGTIDVVDPCTEEHLVSVAAAGPEDIDRAVEAARAALEDPAWRGLRPAARARLILRLADLIERDADEIARWESLNMGMPLSLSRGADVPSSIEELRYNAGWCTRIHGETYTLGAPGSSHAFTLREPIGVVAAIVPWNFPLLTALVKVAPALAAGCTVVLKPAEETPLTALKLGALALEAGFPKGVLNVVPGLGHEAGAALAAHDKVDKVTFTGSTETGRAIVRAAAGNFKRVTLELGGKSPTLILADADLPKAIAQAAGSIFVNSGQVCSAGSRLYAERSVFEQVVEGVQAAARAHKLGPWHDPTTTMGPLVSARHWARVSGFVEEAVAQDAEVVAGGRFARERGYFFPPTVLATSRGDLRVCREEVFGPVLVVQAVDSEDEMVERANDTPYGLAATIWTRDLARAHRLVGRVKAGSVYVNAAAVAGPNFPYGGYKQSGWGRERGREGLDAYLQTKSVGIAL